MDIDEEGELGLIFRSDRQNVVEDIHFLASHDAQAFFCRRFPKFQLPGSVLEIWSCGIFDKDDSEIEAEFSSSEWQVLVAFDQEFIRLAELLPDAVESHGELVNLPEWQNLMQGAKQTVRLFPDVPEPKLPEESDKPKKPWIGEKRTEVICETTVEFNLEEYWWSTELRLCCWGNAVLPIILYTQGEEPSPAPAQFQVLESILTRQEDYRPKFEEEFFTHYQNEIYGSVCGWSEVKKEYVVDELTPPIKQPSDLRSMCMDPSLWIPYPEETDQLSSNQFLLAFECSWDEEHGVSLEITDWQITDFNAS